MRHVSLALVVRLDVVDCNSSLAFVLFESRDPAYRFNHRWCSPRHLLVVSLVSLL